MAKIKTISPITSVSGHTCGKGDLQYVTNHRTGKVYTRRRVDNKRQPTEAQMANRQRFAELQEMTRAWLAENKPSVEQPQGSMEFQLMEAEFRAQHEVGNWYNFVFHQIKIRVSVSM